MGPVGPLLGSEPAGINPFPLLILGRGSWAAPVGVEPTQELLLVAGHPVGPQFQPCHLKGLTVTSPLPLGPDPVCMVLPGHPRTLSDPCSFHRVWPRPLLMHLLTSCPITEREKRLLRVAEDLRLYKTAVQGLTAETL